MSENAFPKTLRLLKREDFDRVFAQKCSVADGRLADVTELEWDPRPAVCVIAASKGYPATSHKGDVIAGLADDTVLAGGTIDRIDCSGDICRN